VHTPDSVDGCETLGSQGHVHFAKLPGVYVCVCVRARACVRETLGSSGHVHFAKLPGVCVCDTYIHVYRHVGPNNHGVECGQDIFCDRVASRVGDRASEFDTGHADAAALRAVLCGHPHARVLGALSQAR
jgi:hypothetical protein